MLIKIYAKHNAVAFRRDIGRKTVQKRMDAYW